MLPIKVAFQGGGARLVTLIAAADVLRDLANRGEITIEAVAGTSAGSFAACMLASEKPFADYLERLRADGPGYLQRLVARSLLTTPQVIQIFRGKSIFNESVLREFAEDIFNGGDKNVPRLKISELPVPTHITLSDLSTRSKVIKSREDDYDLVSAIVDSCAIPFAFRTHKSKSWLVDGGIASNLPTDAVLSSPPDDALPLAFRFPKDPDPKLPTTLEEYGAAIVSTAIDACVELSAATIIAKGGCVCDLPAHFDPTDFAGAITDGLHKSRYATTKQFIADRLSESLKPYKDQRARNKIISGSKSKDFVLYDSHYNLLKSFPYRITQTNTLVCGSSLFDEGDSRRDTNDQIYQSYTLNATGPVVALRVALPFQGVPLQDTEACFVQDRDGVELEAEHIQIVGRDPRRRHDFVDYILIYLNQPATVDQMPLTLTYRTVIPGCLNGLMDGSGEWMKARTGEFAAQQTENQIVLVPQVYDEIEVDDLMTGASKLGAERAYKAAQYCAGQWVVGRPMTKAELGTVFSQSWCPSRLGWRAIGWTAENLPDDHYSGAVFTNKRAVSR